MSDFIDSNVSELRSMYVHHSLLSRRSSSRAHRHRYAKYFFSYGYGPGIATFGRGGEQAHQERAAVAPGVIDQDRCEHGWNATGGMAMRTARRRGRAHRPRRGGPGGAR